MAKKIKAKKSATAPKKGNAQQQMMMLGGVVIVSIILIVGVVIISQQSAGEAQALGENETYAGIPIAGEFADVRQIELSSDVAEGVERGLTEDGIPYIGHPDAPIIIAEFGDFTCIHCANWHSTAEDIITDFVRSGDAQFQYFPMTNNGLDPYATDAARAAICAAEQGGFWEMHDEIFRIRRNESYNSFTPSELERMADRIGLDGSEVRACMNTNRADAAITVTERVARENGASATPTILYQINGEDQWRPIPVGNQISGARDYSVIADIIRQFTTDTETGG